MDDQARLRNHDKPKRKLAALNAVPIKKSCCKSFLRVMFSHVGLFFIVSIYAVVGAYLFIKIEEKQENKWQDTKRRVTLDLQDAVTYMTDTLWYKIDKKINKSSFHADVTKTLDTFTEYVVDKASNSDLQFDGDVESWDADWTMPKSVLYTISIMTTIGYGHISPKTFEGRIATIFYSVIGIPLMLVFLANIGDIMAKSFKYVYSRACCRWCRAKRKMTENKTLDFLPKNLLWSENVGQEEYMPTDEVNVPIVVNLCMIAIYVTMGGFLFHWWEQWELHSSSYFSFITLTSIGYGDLVPGNSFLAYKDGFKAAFKMIVTILYCVFGLSLLSMCIALMQEQILSKVRWAAAEIGLSKEDVDVVEKYKIKRTKRGAVTETPADKDGNKKFWKLKDVEKDQDKIPFINLEDVE